ncbi:unnamed protein product, partial [marine sediment metagenome]
MTLTSNQQKVFDTIKSSMDWMPLRDIIKFSGIPVQSASRCLKTLMKSDM